MHPLRWLAIVLIGVPLALLAVAAMASLLRHGDLARSALRWFIHLFVVDAALVVVLAGYGTVYERANSNHARQLHPPPGKLVNVGGYRLHLDCTGEGGPTVVLIYGMAGSYLDWYRVQPELAKTTRVCSYDRPGYGWSDPGPKPPLPSVNADELHTLLKTAGEKPPFILVGHSLGAFDARMYAHLYPEEVAGIVLVDGAHPDSAIPFPWRERVRTRFLQLTAPFGLPRWRKWCVQGPAQIKELKSAFNCDSRVFAANYALRAAYPQAAAEVRRLGPLGDLPLVVISRDAVRPGSNAAAEQRWADFQGNLANLSTNSRHVIASGSGHGVPIDKPNVVISEVHQILDQARRNKLSR